MPSASIARLTPHVRGARSVASVRTGSRTGAGSAGRRRRRRSARSGATKGAGSVLAKMGRDLTAARKSQTRETFFACKIVVRVLSLKCVHLVHGFSIRINMVILFF